ncbi:DUF4395 domain-containing protein [Phreatobacter aquaticus]|uniref:DUF4395 domain-containing protein n=1 Tax=Phreatobacter aquaticus TaxID=2570229 RepID=A0A4D7QK61_9HYPH|nr:DUF4395 domain-containing protein [Phreatobacter aquaticus]QCK85627.1 DUF4395 domain-containing protein [Phreatobacter aquaticus]
MTSIFQFGERRPEYEVPVLNEREVRAGAGILLLVAGTAFLKAWYLGDFGLTRIVVVAFFVEFALRVLVNPAFAPSLIIGRFFVRNQKPDFVGAPQKQFAWAIGLLMATLMIYLVVLNDVRGPINLLICLACIGFLFFETAFGICIGCSVYNLFNREKAQLCPGGACEIHQRQDIQRVSPAQLAALTMFIALLGGIVLAMPGSAARSISTPGLDSVAEAERCRVPAFAIAIGHAEKWKLHNNCR